MIGCFVTGTGTGVGKTWFGCALAAYLASFEGPPELRDVRALKPIETGCDPEPEDARALAEACGQPELVRQPGFVRMRRPLAPYAATLEGEPPVDVDAVVGATLRAMAGADFALVEGAGGPLVPIDAEHTMRDLADTLGLPTVLVAPDGLGVLSHTLTACETIAPSAVVLSQFGPEEQSWATNRAILAERLECPVIAMPAHPPRARTQIGRALWSELAPLLGAATQSNAARPVTS